MRPTIRYIKENNKENRALIGIEIGVQRGTNALSILKELKIKKLYLIDPYLNSRGKRNYPFLERRILSQEKYMDKVLFIRKTSEDAIKFIPDELDFVYADGSSEYKVYYNDIKEYYNKLRIGGIIGGQIGWSENPQIKYRVLAMEKFMDEHEFIPKICDNEFPSKSKGGRDWWIVKK